MVLMISLSLKFELPILIHFIEEWGSKISPKMDSYGSLKQ